MASRFEVSHATRGARGMRDILHRQLETALAELPLAGPRMSRSMAHVRV